MAVGLRDCWCVGFGNWAADPSLSLVLNCTQAQHIVCVNQLMLWIQRKRSNRDREHVVCTTSALYFMNNYGESRTIKMLEFHSLKSMVQCFISFLKIKII